MIVPVQELRRCVVCVKEREEEVCERAAARRHRSPQKKNEK